MDIHEKNLLYAKVKSAKKWGEIQKSSCQRCGVKKNIHAHHEDYSKPLCVVWLCPKCHRERHRELGWGNGGAPRKGCEYDFSALDVFDFAVLPNETISRISVLTNRFKRYTGRKIKCFSTKSGVVIMRID